MAIKSINRWHYQTEKWFIDTVSQTKKALQLQGLDYEQSFAVLDQVEADLSKEMKLQPISISQDNDQ